MKRWIQIIISIILIGALFYIVDVNQVVETFKQASYSYFILIFITITINRAIMSYKWNLLLRANDIVVPDFEILKIYYMSNFIGLFLPATVGGDVVRLYMVNKKIKKTSEILASIIIERLLGFLVLFVFAFIALIVFLSSLKQSSEELNRLELILGIFILMGVIFIFISFNKKTSKLFKERIYSKKTGFIAKFVKKIEKFHDAYLDYRNRKNELAIFSLLTVAEITTVIIWCYLGILTFNQAVDIKFALVIIPIIQVLNRLPISFDGFGPNEAGYVYFLSFAGISNHISFSIGLFIHIATIIGVMPGALFYAFDKSKIEEIKKQEAEKSFIPES
jgi:uncharacterized protein (TIRG00374 family)